MSVKGYLGYLPFADEKLVTPLSTSSNFQIPEPSAARNSERSNPAPSLRLPPCPGRRCKPWRRERPSIENGAVVREGCRDCRAEGLGPQPLAGFGVQVWSLA